MFEYRHTDNSKREYPKRNIPQTTKVPENNITLSSGAFKTKGFPIPYPYLLQVFQELHLDNLDGVLTALDSLLVVAAVKLLDSAKSILCGALS